MSYFHSWRFSISMQCAQSIGITTVSRSPRLLAMVNPLLVRVFSLSSPSPCDSIPSKTTSLSTLHHQAGLLPASVFARTDVLVNACACALGPGSRQPLTVARGGVKTRTFSSTSFLRVEMFRRSCKSCVGDRNAAFDCVFELRITSKRRSSSDLGLADSVPLKPRFSSAGRCSRAIEFVR